MDASALVAVVAAGIALLAAGASWLEARHARRQADAAERQTELQERTHRDAHQPYVWVDVRADARQGSILRLVARNEGPTVAEDVRITFDPPLRTTQSIKTSVDRVQERLSNGLRSLPPGREMVWYLAMGRELFAEDGGGDDVPHEYTVEITGRGPFGDLPVITYTLNLDDIRETADPRLGTLDHVTKAIDKVAKAIGGQQ